MSDFYNVEYLSERLAAVCKERDELKRERDALRETLERQARQNHFDSRGRGRKKPINQMYASGKVVRRYESVSEAAAAVNGQVSAIAAVCNGKRKSAYGYRWEYDGARMDGE